MKHRSIKLMCRLTHFKALFLRNTGICKDYEVPKSHKLVHLPGTLASSSSGHFLPYTQLKSPAKLDSHWPLEKFFALLTSYPLHCAWEQDLAVISAYRHHLKLSLNEMLFQAT